MTNLLKTVQNTLKLVTELEQQLYGKPGIDWVTEKL